MSYMSWFNNYVLPLFLGMVMYVEEFKTKENKILIKDKIEPCHLCLSENRFISCRSDVNQVMQEC